jgi:hypothetical protein
MAFDLKRDPFETHPILRDKDTAESSVARKNIEKIVREMFHLKQK